MFKNNDFKKNRAQSLLSTKQKKYLTEYTHVICLNEGEILHIGTDTNLIFLGPEFLWGEQARFALKAPDNISILRLELFARRFQYYQYELNVNFGDYINIGDGLQLCLLPLPKERNQVYIRINSKDYQIVKKSFFNGTHIEHPNKNDSDEQC